MTDLGKLKRKAVIHQDKLGLTIVEYYGAYLGEGYEVVRSEDYRIVDFNDEVTQDLLMHGFKQKLGDSTASKETGDNGTTEGRFNTIDSLFAQMDGEKGTFNKAKGAGKSVQAKEDAARSAVMRAKYADPKTPEATRMVLAEFLNIEYKALEG